MLNGDTMRFFPKLFVVIPASLFCAGLAYAIDLVKIQEDLLDPNISVQEKIEIWDRARAVLVGNPPKYLHDLSVALFKDTRLTPGHFDDHDIDSWKFIASLLYLPSYETEARLMDVLSFLKSAPDLWVEEFLYASGRNTSTSLGNYLGDSVDVLSPTGVDVAIDVLLELLTSKRTAIANYQYEIWYNAQEFTHYLFTANVTFNDSSRNQKIHDIALNVIEVINAPVFSWAKNPALTNAQALFAAAVLGRLDQEKLPLLIFSIKKHPDIESHVLQSIDEELKAAIEAERRNPSAKFSSTAVNLCGQLRDATKRNAP